MDHLNRRRFLKCAAAGGLAYAFGRTPHAVSATAFSSSAAFTDYKALVCVFLFGGNDSFNMVVPRSPGEYGVYANSRQNLAIAQSSLLPINSLLPATPTARCTACTLMGEVAALFEQDQACAIVANVGPLIEPTTKLQYQSKAVRLPPQLFSHNDQQDQWHALKGEATLKSGWGGRVAHALTAPGAATPLNQSLAVNLSLSGQTLFQAGVASIPYTMGPKWTGALLRPRGYGRVHARTSCGVREHPARQSRDRLRARLREHPAARSARCCEDHRCASDGAQPKCRAVRDCVSADAARTATQDRRGAHRSSRAVGGEPPDLLLCATGRI